MKDISTIIVDMLGNMMQGKGLELFRVGDDTKYLAIDKDFNTMFKFELSFSERAFVCQTLVRRNNEMMIDDSVNIAWTEGESIRQFFRHIESLQAN